MKKIAKLFNKVVSWISYKKMAILFILIFVISLIPIIYLAFFDYATGDDLLYGSVVRNSIRNGNTFLSTFHAIIQHIVWEYNTFQGTWASGFLWRLEPSIWGEKYYFITPFIALFSLCGGSGYFLYEILINKLKLDKATFWVICSSVLFFLIQYMPTSKAGLYWYTGMIQYVFSYGMAMFSLSWAFRFSDTGRYRYLIGCIVTMSYLGGGGYPEVVLAALGYFFIILCDIKRDAQAKKNRYRWMFIPFLLEMIGFAVSAMAPGNAIRGGSGFGFGFVKVIKTLWLCAIHGLGGCIKYGISIRPLFLLILFLAIVAWEKIDVQKSQIKFSHPVMVSMVLFLFVSAVYAPEMYVGSDVKAGISGGVYNSYYYVFVMCLTFEVIYLTGWQKVKNKDRHTVGKFQGEDLFAKKVRVPFLLFSILFCMIFSKHMVGNMTDYRCIKFIVSGELSDFEAQMKERIVILEDSSILDVVVPEMNDQQGPFMHMALLGDSSKYTNWATELFYNKKTVIAVPREEYYLLKDSKK